MKHLTVGTAGHVDHGKTALIKSLTGFDCDTHKAEKERGVTINLGFTHLTLPSGNIVGIVDVPGHKEFIHTMANGAIGIDIALLVIAANEGVMPQTREHINIMSMLGLTRGFTVLTKIDTVDSSRLRDVEVQVRQYVDTTFLKASPIVNISSVTGEGLEALLSELDLFAQNIPERPNNGPFRMFIDRIFSKPGFGTIVTGSALNGKLTSGGTVFLLPQNSADVTVKGIERFGKHVESISAGDRTAINLSGVRTRNIQRGMVVADRLQRSTAMIDVKVSLLRDVPFLRSQSDVMFYAGGYGLKTKVHILHGALLCSGENGFAQIHLPSPCVLRHGDSFIVRDSSGDRTLGGGTILDAHPLHHKKQRGSVVSDLTDIDSKGISELIAQNLKRRSTVATLQDIADKLNFSKEELLPIVKNELPSDIHLHDTAKELVMLSETTADALMGAIIEHISLFHKTHPFENRGLTEREIANGLAIDRISEEGRLWVVRHLLTILDASGQAQNINGTWTIPRLLKTHHHTLDPKAAAVDKFLEDRGNELKLPTKPEWTALKKHINISDKDLKQILHFLHSNNSTHKTADGFYLHVNVVDRVRNQLVDALKNTKEGITVADFRDIIHGNRKTCLAMLEIFDAEGTTIREGDYRFLATRGIETKQGEGDCYADI